MVFVFLLEALIIINAKMEGKEVNELYSTITLEWDEEPKVTSADEKPRLWHKRLGHCRYEMIWKSTTKVNGIDPGILRKTKSFAGIICLGKRQALQERQAPESPKKTEVQTY